MELKNSLCQSLLLICMVATGIGCNKDDDKVTKNQSVLIKEDGSTSNGSIFSAIDDHNFYLDYIKYTVEEGHLVVMGYDKVGLKGAAKIVPSVIYHGNSYEVLEIKYRAFYNCTRLTSIEVPNSITSIGVSAFTECTGLTSVIIPNSVTSIGDFAFDGCKSLTSINITSSVTSIGYSAFRDCTGLTSINIPSSVTSIGDAAFEGCI